VKPKISVDKNHIHLGEISGLHGVQGWVKVFSNAQPRENIFSYQPWQLYSGEKVLEIDVQNWRKQGKTLVAKIKGINSRDEARDLMGAVIAISESQLPPLDKGEFYWSQLVGMQVLSDHGGVSTQLGQVGELMETGANDVLVVRDQGKGTERLIPWVPDEFIKKVDLKTNLIEVNWDPEF